MEKDKRYTTVKVLIETGTIKSFPEIFETIPKTVVASDLRVNYTHLTKRLNNSEEFTLKELATLADLIGIDSLILIGMVLKYMKKKGKK